VFGPLLIAAAKSHACTVSQASTGLKGSGIDVP
jgi:hypothetical protein